MVQIYTDVRQSKFSTGDRVKPKGADGPICTISGITVIGGKLIHTLKYGEFECDEIEAVDPAVDRG